MSDEPESEERAELTRINEQLKVSLARCRFMLADARAKLAANSNEPEEAAEDEDGQERSG